MNKIYKVMYSKVKQCAVVVSEIAKSHGHNGESSGVRKHAALTAAVLIALGSLSFTTAFVPMTAEAADKTRTDGSNFVGVERTDGLFEDSDYANHNGQGAHGDDSITIGLKASGGDGTITIGDRRAEKSLGSVYVGRGPGMPTGKVLPSETDDGYWATSVGYQSDATGYGSIAIGSNATANNSYDKDSTGHGIDLKTKSGDGKSFVLKGKPDIQRASVAIGYGASADNGNIAIGSYSDASTDLHGKEINSYLTNKKADSYVSVGKSDALRRISNVADGAANSDVATIAQLKEAVKETDASKKANIDASNIGKHLKFKADGKTAADSSDITTNEDAWGEAIGTGKVQENNGQLVTGGTVYSALENQKKDLSVHAGWGISVAKDEDGKTISLNRNLGRDAYTKDKAVLKADENKSALVIGGRVNPGDATGGQTAEKDYGALGQDSVTVGGADNTVRENGDAAVVIGGTTNTASAQYSTVAGGNNNDAFGNESSVFGGFDNDAFGAHATLSGGSMNRAYGAAASVFGGGVNSALGDSSVAVGGLQSTVNGTFAVGIAGGSTNADYALAAGNGANVTVENGTAIGYQATTDEAGTIAFGHDAGDAYYSSTTWPQKATKQNGKYYDANNKEISKAKYDALKNSDGTWNDYSKTPTVVEKTYDKAAYNRLVKVADGQDDHDVVVMEQLKQYVEKDASNLGNNIEVYKTDKNGNVQLDENKKPVKDEAATTTAQKNSKDAWGQALGAGTLTAATAKDSDQLITGKTLYDYDKPTGSMNYVKVNNTTGQNLSALDAQVKSNADTLNDKTHNIKYYSVSDNAPTLGFDSYSNAGNDGAKGKGSLAAGFVTHADGIASTVVGSYSGVMNTGTALGPWGLDYRGATAVSLGTVNVNNNTDTSKLYSGVANSIVGQANMTTDSNAAIIVGAGNTVTNSYRPIDTDKALAILGSVSDSTDPTKLSKAMQDAVKESGGQVMVMGGGNTVDKAYMTQVVGVGNTVTGSTSEYNENTSNTSTQLNYVDGFYNTIEIGKNNYVIGSHNTLTGSSVDTNKSNLVLGDNHKLTNQKNNVILGSADDEQETKASEAVVIGHNADVTVDGGVAIGSGSVSTATDEANAEGYDPVSTNTNKASTNDSATWKATTGAVSIGGVNGNTTTTRRITNLAAGFNDTDAVNVAQIKKLASINASNIGANLQYGADGTTEATDIDKTENKKAWATAIGTGTVTKDDDGSKQMVTGKTVYDALHGGLDNITVGKDGQNGKDGSIGIAGQNGKDGYTMTIIKTEQGAAGVDGKDGKDGITRVIYQDKDGSKKHTIATLDDGLKFKGDNSTVITKKLDEQLNIIGGASTELTESNIGVNSTTDGSLKIQLAKNLAGITSIANQTTTGEGDAQTITGAKIDLRDDGSISVNGGKITDVKSGLTATDGTYADTDKNNAANIGDVHSMIEKEAGNTDDKLALKANVAADNIGTHITDTTAQKTNLNNWGAAIGTGAVADSTNEHANQLVTGKTVYDALHGGLDNITVGKDGQNGKDGSIGIAGQNGKDGYTMTIIKTEQGAAGVDGKDGKDGITRVIYQDKDGSKKHTIATLDDGLKFKGDNSTVITKKLDEQLNIIGGASTELTESNIGVNSTTDGSLKIQLAKDLTSITSISGSTDDKGAKITLDTTDKNISLNGGSIKDVASNLTKDGKIINGSDNNAASISDVQTLVQQGVDNGYTNGNGITIQKDGTSNVISVNKGDGLTFDNGKLAVNTGDGLTVDETTKALKIKTSDSNLKVDQNGIGLNNVITIGTAGTNAHPITIDGTKGEVSGLTNTTWSSTADYSQSTKAATESQVAQAMIDAVNKAGANDTHVAAGSYTVNDQHQISMNLVDQNNNNKGTVTITDVAKASEMGDVSKLADGVKNAGGKTTTVVDAINNVNTSMNTKIGDQNYSKSNTSGTNKYVSDGDSITSAIGKLDGAVQQATTAAGQHSTVSAGSNITVTPAKQTDGHTDYQVALNKDITVDSVTAKTATTDTLTVNKSATIGGVTIANKTISGLDDTKIEKGSTNAVNAGTIWNELRPSGGTYINQNNTTAQNITNLDTQVKKNSDLVNSDGSTIKIGSKDSATKVDISDKNGSGRVVTGVVTDAADPTSAANVGYVNGVTAANTQQIYRDMNNAYGRLNNNINKAAAGSNALAALHPLDYDPDDKADFAVGYGHYRNANAAAVGAFYHPNENTMVNVGVSLGNGDPGFNAGVSFKVGRGGAGREAMSKTEMAKVINSQSKEIDALKKDNADKDKRIDALEQKMAEILAKLDKNGK